MCRTATSPQHRRTSAPLPFQKPMWRMASSATNLGGLLRRCATGRRQIGMTTGATGFNCLRTPHGMIAMASGALRRFIPGLQNRPMATRLVTLSLIYMASAAKRWHLFAHCNPVRSCVAAGRTVLLTGAVAGVATNTLGEVFVAFHIAGSFRVALSTGLMHSRLLNQ